MTLLESKPALRFIGGRSGRRSRYLSYCVAVAASLTPLPGPERLAAQQAQPTPGAMLVGTVFDSTSAALLSGAAVYLVGTSHVTVSDSEGAFALPGLEGGEYTISVRHARFDSIGLDVPPSWGIRMPAAGILRVSLAVPSMSTLMPGLCILGDAERRGIAVGTVRDAATGTPLPRAAVVFEVPDGSSKVVEADGTGRYVACGLPSDQPIVTRVTFLGRAPAVELLTFTNDQPVFRSFELELSPGVDVTGRVVDQSTAAPVSGAVVKIESAEGEVGSSLTDEQGRFRFERVELDTYLVEVEHIAYGSQMKWFSVSDVEPLELELGLVPDAIELDALVVSVRPRGLGRAVDAGVRRDFVSRIEIERLLGAARNVGDLVRTIPGVRVQNLRDSSTGQMRLCIEGSRTYTPACDSVLVVIDGVMTDAEMLEDLPPNIIQSIEFVPSIIAGMRYGGRTGSGVLEITTVR